MHRLGSLCSGYGGLDIAVQSILDTELTWWSDIEPDVMRFHHPDVPNLGDIKTVDWASVPPVDILTAGYPCQPFSNAGKRLGTEDPRHLWPWIADAIGVLRPRLIILENVAAHLRRGFDVVSADLAALGYDVRWTIVRASDAGAPHRRERLYIVAHTASEFTHGGGPLGALRRSESSDRCGIAPDALGVGWPQGWAEPTGQQGRPDVASDSREAITDPDSPGSPIREIQLDGQELTSIGRGHCDWREFTPAINRWERITGRLTPLPTQIGQRGATVLSPRFVEWMMGLDDGHVTSVPGLSRTKQIQFLGNGVVPQQAILALKILLEKPWDVSSSAPTPPTSAANPKT